MWLHGCGRRFKQKQFADYHNELESSIYIMRPRNKGSWNRNEVDKKKGEDNIMRKYKRVLFNTIKTFRGYHQ